MRIIEAIKLLILGALAMTLLSMILALYEVRAAVLRLEDNLHTVRVQAARTEGEVAGLRVTTAASILALRGPERVEAVRLTAFALTDAQTGGRPDKTALGTTPIVGKTAAVHPSMAGKFLNRRVYIPGHGVWHVTSVTSRNIAPNTLDLCKPVYEAARFTPVETIAVALD